MKYLYTNLQLGWILDRDGDGKIDWAACGFSMRAVRRAMGRGAAQGDVPEIGPVSVLPIDDESKVNAVVMPAAQEEITDGEFCKIIEQEEADLIATSFVTQA